MPSANPNYTMTDALLILALACRLVGTDEGVRASARRIVGKMSAEDQPFISRVIQGRDPVSQVKQALQLVDPDPVFVMSPLASIAQQSGSILGQTT